jgi:replicative DNA helicase
MQTRKQKGGNPTPDLEFCRAEEAEKGLVSIILNNPDEALLKITEAAFSVADIFDIQLRNIAEITLQQAAQGKATDIRVIYELARKDTHLEFYQLSDLYTACPILSLTNEFIELTRTAAKRRTMQIVLHNAQTDIRSGDLNEFLTGLVAVSEGVQNEIAPPKVLDTKAQLMEATTRYETGDDNSTRIRTGFPEIDNMTPMRETDLIVVGGETKSGKTTWVLNVIANIIKHEISQLNTAQN